MTTPHLDNWEERFDELIVKEAWPLADYENVKAFIRKVVEDTHKTSYLEGREDQLRIQTTMEKSLEADARRDERERIGRWLKNNDVQFAQDARREERERMRSLVKEEFAHTDDSANSDPTCFVCRILALLSPVEGDSVNQENA